MSGYVPFDFSVLGTPPAAVAADAALSPDSSPATDGMPQTPQGMIREPKSSESSTAATAANAAGKDASAETCSDSDTLLAYLHNHGATSYGAFAMDAGVGGTRAWQVEAALLATGRIRLDPMGRMVVISIGKDA